MINRLLNILTALDAFLFACICLGGAKRGEYASSAAWDMRINGKWRGYILVALIDGLFFFDPNHCYWSWKGQQGLYEPGNTTLGFEPFPRTE